MQLGEIFFHLYFEGQDAEWRTGYILRKSYNKKDDIVELDVAYKGSDSPDYLVEDSLADFFGTEELEVLSAKRRGSICKITMRYDGV